MTNAFIDVVGASATERKSRLRAITVAAGVALAVAVAAMLALVAFQGPAAAQTDVGALIRSIVCPILTALANGPLGDFIRPIINSLLAAFGCGVISG